MRTHTLQQFVVRGLVGGVFGIVALAGSGSAPAQENPAAEIAPRAQAASIPDLSGYWQRRGRFPSTWELPEDPSLRPGPLVNTNPDEETVGLIWIADHESPLLKPWNREYLKARGEHEVIEVNTVAHNVCWPSGVPQVANMREPVQFLQADDQVTILYQRDHMVRRVDLNQAHPENIEASWYGHSIGHYEGDTLVIDTVGMNDQTGVDRFNTQHTEQLHVVERYRVIEDGQALRVMFAVEDPGAFNMAWYGQATYRRVEGPINEIVCAENNRDILTGGEFPIPRDNSPDY